MAKTKRFIGQFYQGLDGKKYILAQTAFYKVSLIDLSNGNRHCDAVKVKNIFDITPNQWTKITGMCGARYFKKIS